MVKLQSEVKDLKHTLTVFLESNYRFFFLNLINQN